MKRGDIYWVNLDSTVGSEIRKQRPCVVVGDTPINKARRTVVVIPLSTSARPIPPITIAVKCLDRQGVAVCDQIRAVDKSRLIKSAGTLSAEDIQSLNRALKQVLCL